MIVNIFLVIVISSIYLIGDLFDRKRVPVISYHLVLLSSLIWLFLNIYNNQYLQSYELSLLLFSNLSFFFYLLHFFSIKEKNIKKLVVSFLILGISFLFFQFQYVFYLISNEFLFSSKFNLSLLTLTKLYTIYVISNYSSFLIFPKLYSNFDYSRLFLVQILLIMLISYFFKSSYQLLKYVYFFFLYFIFYFPFYFKRPLLILRHYIRSIIFSAMFITLSIGYISLLQYTDFITFTSPFKLAFFILSGLIFPLFFTIFERLSKFIDKLSIFSTVNSNRVQALIHQLSSITEFQDLLQLFKKQMIFNSTDYNIKLWYKKENNNFDEITGNSLTLDDDIISFMQFKETIYLADFDYDLSFFNKTPLSQEFSKVYNFMKEHQIVSMSLLQKSNNVVGVFAVSYSNWRFELSEYDDYQMSLLQDSIVLTFSNLNFINKMMYHQQMLVYLNMSISSFNEDVVDHEYHSMVQACCLGIIPEIQYSLILEYDSLTKFYKQSAFFSNQDQNVSLKFHYDDVVSILENNLYVTVSIEDNISQDFLNLMNTLNVQQMTFIRAHDQGNPFIFVMLYNADLNISYYRISFCQAFLSQVESFFQYQKVSSELFHLEDYLRNILDQLPIGILIVNSNRDLVYMNAKLEDDTGLVFTDHAQKQLSSKLLNQDIIKSVENVFDSEDHSVRQIECDFNSRKELYLISSFRIPLEKEDNVIVVLANIQQSKELFEQMNQTNRLAMMSKIAKGISYELNKPVEKLIDGVHLLKYQWNSSDFQNYFKTDVVPQVDRINLLCQSLLRLSRSSSESLNEVYLPDIVEQVLRLIAGDLRYQKHKFYVSSIDKLTIVLDQVMAIQILMNLLIFSFKSLAIEKSKIFLDFVVNDSVNLRIKIRIDAFNQDGFSNDKDLKDQLELSIVNQIVLNQNGQFDIFKEQHLAVLDVQIPISSYANKTVASPSKNISR